MNGNGGGGAGNGGARLGDHRHLDRAPRARRVRHGDGDERRQPRLRAARLRRARRLVLAGRERLRRRGERRARAARRLARTDRPPGRDRRQRRADRPGPLGPDGKTVLALGFGASQSEAVGAAGGLARARSSTRRSTTTRRAGRTTTSRSTSRARRSSRGSRRPERQQLEDEYYLSANVIKASEDKTFPGAIVASLASPWGQAISAGDPAEHVLRLVPRGVRARPVRGVDRPPRGRRPRDRARRDALPLRPAAAARRLDAAEQPRQRQARAGLVRDAARRGRVPDPDGRPARAHRRVAVRGPHQARRELRRRARPVVRRRALGGAERLLAVDDRGRDRRASSRRPTSRARTATRRRPRSGSASPTTGSARSRAGR